MTANAKENPIQESYLQETDLLKEGLLMRLTKIQELEDRLKENVNEKAEGLNSQYFGF